MKNETNMKSTSTTDSDSCDSVGISTGEYIRKKRKGMHLTQEKLGDAIGVDKRSISDWENNKIEPSMTNLEKLAKVLHVSIPELWQGRDIDLDEQTKADLDQKIKETAQLADTLDERSITSMDIAISAFGVAIVAVALAFIALFDKAIWACLIGAVAFIFGIVFISVGGKLIKRLEKDREDRTSVK